MLVCLSPAAGIGLGEAGEAVDAILLLCCVFGDVSTRSSEDLLHNRRTAGGTSR